MRGDFLLTFNAGSSTIKLSLFALQQDRAVRIGKGTIDLRRQPFNLRLVKGLVAEDVPLSAPVTSELHEVLEETISRLAEHFPPDSLAVAGHRVVHGGDRFPHPALVDEALMDAVTDLFPLAPLHQPQSVQLIRAIRHLRPSLLQTASFDTAFHQSQSDIVRRFALPRQLHDAGVKRYGFHGLSYKSIAATLSRRHPSLANGKVVVAHLGSGASLCALDRCISRDTSMGFSTLDGIPMATRCGALDPGVLLYLIGQRGMAEQMVEDTLYHQSGLLGLSGISADSRELLASARPEAKDTLDVFALRTAGEISRLATTLGGVDAVVFTAGIGENQPEVRLNICRRLAWLGLEIDATANLANAETISVAASRIAVLVIPTDEEQVIADEALTVMRASSGDQASA